MVTNPACLAHAAGGEDDLWGSVLVDGLRILRRDGKPQAVEPDRVDACIQHRLGLLVKIAVVALQEDAGGLHRQWRVHVHREIPMAGNEIALLDFPDGIQHLLGTAHGKGGNHQIAPLVQGLLNIARQLLSHIPAFLLMQPIAVGGLDYQVVRLLHRLGVPEQGLVDVAHVAAEYDFLGQISLGQPQFDGR